MESRKVDRISDLDIARYNSVGLSYRTIAKIIKCHPTTVSLRLQDMGIKPVDTRRSFMEDVYLGLEKNVQDWLSQHLFNNQINIQDFISKLITDAFETAPEASAAHVEGASLLSSVG